MIEKLLLQNLATNEEFSRKVLPFLKDDYFQSRSQKTLFNVISSFIEKYNALPSKAAIEIEIDKTNLTDQEIKDVQEDINYFYETSEQHEIDWLVSESEKFCQDKAIFNAITQSIKILEGTSKQDKGAIPEILSDALGVSFDSHVGHDFLEDFENRYEYYHRKERRIPFDLEYFNKITKDGIPSKTLNVIIAGTNVGKSLFMCHAAAANLSKGHDVLYITLEMSQEEIAKRIDQNLLDITTDDLMLLPKDAYQKKMERLRSKIKGKLIVKEYPTASAGTSHFRHLLNELKIKRNFKPSIIYIDYLNICVSSRLKFGGAINSYSYVKAIAEELRGLAVEADVPVFTATQTNRTGFTSSDIGLEDTSESFGLPQTADFMFALISTEELQDLGQFMVKQLKNRYSDPSFNRRFVIGVDRSKMKLYDVEQHAQDNIVDDAPVFDNSETGRRMKGERKFDKDVFEGFS
jgi:replicative DNA helicase